ncbi:TRP-like ion channel Pkd2 [Desmophyllum pertusum]|uniref:TRP-like ion channel Pkd2 n=1 Tax=Desmophyllum pertusum TaxID=174260 RepID=A0A9W9ZZ90_9CNID|nr:TRP-like ion channel Pkd2 [Desmophyllum pertusum]
MESKRKSSVKTRNGFMILTVAIRMDSILENPPRFPSPGEEQLHVARQRRTKQKQMKAIIREMFLYLSFILVMCVVAYGSRDTQAYAVTEALTDIFRESQYTSLLPFDASSESPKFWKWIEDSLVPSLQPQYWYGPFIDEQEEQLWSEESVQRRVDAERA